MAYIRMFIALAITVWLIVSVNNKKEKIIPVCVFYYIVTVLNDIFSAGGAIELANCFGISYQIGDVITLIFIGVLTLDSIRYMKIKRNIFNTYILYLVLALICGSISGVILFGASSEWIGDIRTSSIFIFGLIYFARFFRVEYLQKYIILIDKVMLSILVLSVVIWALDIALGFHPLESQYNGMLSDGGSTMRFIQSFQVLGIALYSLYLFRKDIRKKSYIGMKTTAFLIVVVLFQHRSVWMSLFLGVIVIIMQENSVKKIKKVFLFQFIAILLTTWVIITHGSGALIDNIRNSFAVFVNLVSGKSIENTTASTRTEVWEAVKADLTGVSILIGRPFGYGYGKAIGWETSPHGGYIRMLARTGYIGLSVFFAFLGSVFLRTLRKGIVYGPEFIAFIIAYMYGYDYSWICGATIGCCIAYLNRHKLAGETDNNLI